MRQPREGDIERDIVPRPVSDKVDAELEFHVDMKTRELIVRGVAPHDAREQALAAFGDISGVRAELTRIGRTTEMNERRARFFADAWQDVRFAWRMVTRRRAATMLMIGVLALG